MLRGDEAAAHVPGELHGDLEHPLAAAGEGYVHFQPGAGRRRRAGGQVPGADAAALLARALDVDPRREEPARRPVLGDEPQQQVARRHGALPEPLGLPLRQHHRLHRPPVNRSNTALTTARAPPRARLLRVRVPPRGAGAAGAPAPPPSDPHGAPPRRHRRRRRPGRREPPPARPTTSSSSTPPSFDHPPQPHQPTTTTIFSPSQLIQHNQSTNERTTHLTNANKLRDHVAHVSVNTVI